jgi:MoxR-like ATPase
MKTVTKKVLEGKVENLDEQIPTIPIKYDLYAPKRFGKYIAMGNELDLLKCVMKAGLPFLMEGEKGIGKTMAVVEACADDDTPLVSFSCSTGTTMGDIIGREHLHNGNSVFKLGVLPTAIKVANHFGKAVLYLDELNALDPEIQKMLNPVIDDRRSLIVNNELFELDEGVEFTIIATQNPSYYAGVNPLNEDLRSRFVGKVIEYPTTKQISSVIDWTDIPKREVQAPLLALAVDTLSMKKDDKVDYVISVRDIALFTKCYRAFLKNKALKSNALEYAIESAILIKYADPEEREVIRARAQDTFGVNVY